MIINTISFDKYIAEIHERENVTRFANCPYSVMFKQLTPKAKFHKEKVLNHYVYKSLTDAENAARNWIDTLTANIQRREADKQKRKEADMNTLASDHYTEGDIIVNTWGWEQTNVNFYQVVKVGNRTIDIVEIDSAMTEGSMQSHGMACDVVPVKDSFRNEGDSYRLTVKSDGVLSSPKSYYYMHKWDGRPEYKSWYA
jgi:hypothetical protein